MIGEGDTEEGVWDYVATVETLFAKKERKRELWEMTIVTKEKEQWNYERWALLRRKENNETMRDDNSRLRESF